MNYPVALIWCIAAGREADVLAQLPLSVNPEEPGVLTVDQPEGRFRFAYRRVRSEAGIEAVSFAARPSSGAGGQWNVYILQAYDDTRPAIMRELRDRLVAWAAAHQPTAGKWHLLGPYTPGPFQALAPPAVWAACVNSWWTVWRGESSPAGIAAQQAATDADLDEAGV